MICKMRRSIPLFLSVGAFFISISLTLAAQSVVTEPSYVTASEMRSFVYPTVVGALATALAGFAGVLAFILNREHGSSKEDRAVQREQFAVVGKAMEAIGASVKEALEALKEHDESPTAHMIASAHNHTPMQQDIKEIKEQLVVLLSEHRFMHSTEDRMCALLARRDPKISPHPRRNTDPVEFDGRDLRGKKIQDVEEE